MTTPNASVDGYIRKNKDWAAELTALRTILHDTPLVEEIKWRVPCYTLGGKNVAFMGPMKQCCVLSFVKGALLKDEKNILIQQTEQSQQVRVIRFADVGEIEKLAKTLKAYLLEAVELEKSGAKIELKKIDDYPLPAELQTAFDNDTEFETAFRSLTPGRQRGYLIHFGSAKQEKTRVARIDKHRTRIMDGKGIDDE